MNRRGFLKGLLSSVALPAISLPIANTISMRVISDYVPAYSGSVDVLYGSLKIKPEWVNEAVKLFNNPNMYIQGDL
jgi:hypothetical protein